MSSGSASKLVNGENKKENVHGYEYGNRKENESGAAGSTAFSIVALAGDTSNATTTATATTTSTTTSSFTTTTTTTAATATINTIATINIILIVIVVPL